MNKKKTKPLSFSISSLPPDKIETLKISLETLGISETLKRFPQFTIYQLRKLAKDNGININGIKNHRPEIKLLNRLRKGPWSIPEIAKEFNTSEEEAVRLVDKLYKLGHEIIHDRETKVVRLSFDPTEYTTLQIDPEKERRKGILRYVRRILIIHGTVLGSKYSNPTLLHTLYDIAEKKFEVDFAIHIGDVVTGQLSRKREGESFLTNPDEQIQYTLQNYPRSKTFKTYMISGTRDLTIRSAKGRVVNVIRKICSDDSRKDLIYRGDLWARFQVKGVRIEVINPGEDYAPYSKSYPLQNIVTNLISEEESHSPVSTTEDDAVIAVVGGAHVYDRIKLGNIYGILVPSLQSLTPHQKRKRKRGSGPVIGACILELHFNEDWTLKRDKGRDGIRIRLIKLNKYQKQDDYKERVVVKNGLSEMAQKILIFLEEQPRTEGEISRYFKINKEQVWASIEELQRSGYQILTPKDTKQKDTKQFELVQKQASNFTPLPWKEFFVHEHKAGFCSDTHFGSNDQLWSLVNKFYEICEEEEVDVVFHTGDWSAGEFNHPANSYKVLIPSTEGQMRFLIDYYPKLKGNKKTVGIGGNHDAQHGKHKGLDPLRAFFAEKRPDIVYLGSDVGFWKLGKINIELLHPAGGTGYALSYKGQNIIESEIRLNRSRRLKDKIHVLALGNWHVFNEQVHSEAIVLCVPCFQQQTIDYMKPKGLDPWIGGLICEFVTDSSGYVTEFVSEFIDMASMANTPDFPDMPLKDFVNRYHLLK
jgi:biotin operon repressor/predicted phosphodiesterase